MARLDDRAAIPEQDRCQAGGMSELPQDLTLALCLLAWWFVRTTAIGWSGLLLILVAIAVSYEVLVGA
jgi:hypothetical protein